MPGPLADGLEALEDRACRWPRRTRRACVKRRPFQPVGRCSRAAGWTGARTGSVEAVENRWSEPRITVLEVYQPGCDIRDHRGAVSRATSSGPTRTVQRGHPTGSEEASQPGQQLGLRGTAGGWPEAGSSTATTSRAVRRIRTGRVRRRAPSPTTSAQRSNTRWHAASPRGRPSPRSDRVERRADRRGAGPSPGTGRAASRQAPRPAATARRSGTRRPARSGRASTRPSRDLRARGRARALAGSPLAVVSSVWPRRQVGERARRCGRGRARRTRRRAAAPARLPVTVGDHAGAPPRRRASARCAARPATRGCGPGRPPSAQVDVVAVRARPWSRPGAASSRAAGRQRRREARRPRHVGVVARPSTSAGARRRPRRRPAASDRRRAGRAAPARASASASPASTSLASHTSRVSAALGVEPAARPA